MGSSIMDSSSLEKQVEELLSTPKFEQALPEFEMKLPNFKGLLGKDMVIGSLGTAMVGTVTGLVDNVTKGALAGLPVGSSAILGGIALKKFGKNPLLTKLGEGIMQGGLATLMIPFVNKIAIPSFSQEVKEEAQELNPLVKGVMW